MNALARLLLFLSQILSVMASVYLYSAVQQSDGSFLVVALALGLAVVLTRSFANATLLVRWHPVYEETLSPWGRYNA